MATKEEIYLFSKRNEEEGARLRHQHKTLTRVCGDGIVEQWLPKAKFNAVADVGTGTGIWLIEASQQLGSPEAANRIFTGFDLSAAQFPANPPSGTEFITHDALQPFPEQFHGRYDLVNIRLLALAIPTDLLPVVLGNVVAILKPGGLVHWMEPDFVAQQEQPAPALTEFMTILLQFCKVFKFSPKTSLDVEQAANVAGLVDIRRTRYSSEGRRELDDDIFKWITTTVVAAVPPALLRNGDVKTMEEGKAQADRMIVEVGKLHDQGIDFSTIFDIVTARKP